MNSRPRTPVDRVGEDFGWTERQRQVLALLAARRTNSEIATELGLTLDGAKWHVSEVMSKLDTGSRDEAAEYWRAYNRLPLRFSRAMRAWWKPALGASAAAGVLAVGTVALVAGIASHDEGGQTEDAANPPGGTPTPPQQDGLVPSADNPARVWTIERADEDTVRVFAYRNDELLCLRVERSALRPEALLETCLRVDLTNPPIVSSEVMEPGLVMGIVEDSAAVVEVTEWPDPSDRSTIFQYEAAVVPLPERLGVNWGVWLAPSHRWWSVRVLYGDSEFSIDGFDLDEQISHRFDFDYQFCGSHFIFLPHVAGPECAAPYFATIGVTAEQRQRGEENDWPPNLVYADGRLCGELSYTNATQITPDGGAEMLLGTPDQPESCGRDGALVSLVRADGVQLAETNTLEVGERILLRNFNIPAPHLPTLTPVPTPEGE